MYLCRSARSRKRKFDVIFDEDAATESSTNSSSSSSESESESSTRPPTPTIPKINGHKNHETDGENDNEGVEEDTDGQPAEEKDELPMSFSSVVGSVIEKRKKGRGRPPGGGGGSGQGHTSSGEDKYSSSAEIIDSQSNSQTDEELMLVPIRNAAKTALIQNHGKDRAIELENERRLRKISLLQQAVKPPVPKGHSRRTTINKRELEIEKSASSLKDFSFHKNLICRGQEYKEGNIYSIEANDETDHKGYQTYFCQIKGLLYLNDHPKEITDCAIVAFNWILPIRPFNADLDKFNLMDFDIDDHSEPSYLSTNYLTFVCECPPDFFRIKRLHFMGEIEP